MPFIPELNLIKKDWRKVDLKVALCYPNVYRAGMTGLTVRLLYTLFNARKDVLCERFFIPTLREPWKSFESQQPLKKFDVIAFTLQYEEDYPNVVRMLIEAGIPPRRENRKAGDPLVLAGGPCSTANPEPLADYVDLFVIGEAESILDPLIDRIMAFETPSEHIEEFVDVKGIYVTKIGNPTERVWIRNLDEALHPLAQQTPLVDEQSPYMTIFGKTLVVEPVRGCSRYCRFCLLRNISQPRRERSLNAVEEIIDEGLQKTAVGKVTIIGAGISDYSSLEDVCELVVSHGLDISIPSIRPESVTEHLAALLAKGHQRNVSMAPDAASYRMQKIIDKRMDEATIIDAVKTLLSQGINRLKLYFIVGLPGETPKDVEAIADLSKKIANIGYRSKAIHLSINPLVPKPHTPFQWENTPSVSYVRRSLILLRKKFRRDGRFLIRSLDPRHAQIQALLSLGDKNIGKAVELVAYYGGGLGSWRRAIKECGFSLSNYTSEKSFEEPLPWEKINIGLSRTRILREAKRYMKDVFPQKFAVSENKMRQY